MKNLLYSIYARADNQEWESNIDYLNKYINIFDGARYYIIHDDDTTIPPEQIFNKLVFDRNTVVVTSSNDPILCETAGFVDAIGDLIQYDPKGQTFYAHTKGVTATKRGRVELNRIRAWRELMYDECLSNIDKILEILNFSSCAGCFMYNGGWPDHVGAQWHYSGNFWWVSNAALIDKQWGKIGTNRFAVEAYLGTLLDPKEAFNLYSGPIIPKQNPDRANLPGL